MVYTSEFHVEPRISLNILLYRISLLQLEYFDNPLFQLSCQVDLEGFQKEVWETSVNGINHRKRNRRNGLHLEA